MKVPWLRKKCWIFVETRKKRMSAQAKKQTDTTKAAMDDADEKQRQLASFEALKAVDNGVRRASTQARDARVRDMVERPSGEPQSTSTAAIKGKDHKKKAQPPAKKEDFWGNDEEGGIATPTAAAPEEQCVLPSKMSKTLKEEISAAEDAHPPQTSQRETDSGNPTEGELQESDLYAPHVPPLQPDDGDDNQPVERVRPSAAATGDIYELPPNMAKRSSNKHQRNQPQSLPRATKNQQPPLPPVVAIERKRQVADHPPYDLGAVNRGRIVDPTSDPIVQALEQKLRERRQAEKLRNAELARRAEEFQRQQETARFERDAREQERKEEEHRLKQTQVEQRIQELQKKEEERQARVASLGLKVNKDLLLGKRSMFDVFEEKKKALEEEDKRLFEEKMQAIRARRGPLDLMGDVRKHEVAFAKKIAEEEEARKAKKSAEQKDKVAQPAPRAIETKAMQRIIEEEEREQEAGVQKRQRARRLLEERVNYQAPVPAQHHKDTELASKQTDDDIGTERQEDDHVPSRAPLVPSPPPAKERSPARKHATRPTANIKKEPSKQVPTAKDVMSSEGENKNKKGSKSRITDDSKPLPAPPLPPAVVEPVDAPRHDDESATEEVSNPAPTSSAEHTDEPALLLNENHPHHTAQQQHHHDDLEQANETTTSENKDTHEQVVAIAAVEGNDEDQRGLQPHPETEVINSQEEVIVDTEPVDSPETIVNTEPVDSPETIVNAEPADAIPSGTAAHAEPLPTLEEPITIHEDKGALLDVASPQELTPNGEGDGGRTSTASIRTTGHMGPTRELPEHTDQPVINSDLGESGSHTHSLEEPLIASAGAAEATPDPDAPTAAVIKTVVPPKGSKQQPIMPISKNTKQQQQQQQQQQPQPPPGNETSRKPLAGAKAGGTKAK